jgi:hypothetical protein
VKFSVEKQFTPNLSSHFVITESERIHMRVSHPPADSARNGVAIDNPAQAL